MRLALFFKDFAAWVCDASCIGLHVAGYTTAKYLRDNGVDVSVFPVRHNIDVVDALKNYNATHNQRITHAVISAPWLSAYDVQTMLKEFPDIVFVILSHSNVGFLQADPGGVELFRRYAELSKVNWNLNVGGNSQRFADWFERAYGDKCVCLPNLYSSPKIKSKVWEGPLLNIGAFGAIRPEKNFMTAAGAAIVIQRSLGVPVDFHMITGGEVHHAMALRAITEMTKDIDGFKLVAHKWETWDKFIKLVASMDLLVQPSFTESFNLTVADGISVGVPSVVSPVIHWAPASWKADPDSAVEVAEVGVELLNTAQGYRGYNALSKHNERGLQKWMEFLSD